MVAGDGIDGIDYCPVSAEIAILLQVAPLADRYVLVPPNYVLSVFGNNETRRAMLRKVVAAAASTAGVAGAIAFLTDGDDGPSSQPQERKSHSAEFRIGADEGMATAEYDVTVPDPDPEFEYLEQFIGGRGGDIVDHDDDCTHVDGGLDTTVPGPRYDIVYFDGSVDTSDFHWNADEMVEVIIDDEVK